jgi:diadenosine tetraphosphate (Ap4A) HIT family hydrolase
MRPSERYAPDLDAYHERARTEPCFVCGIVARDPDFSDHHVVYEDGDAIAFFNEWPTQRGYSLVAPGEHREQATGDFTVDEYLALQRIVYGVAEAVREEVGPERVYVLSLGSDQGNAHVHWHVLPLSPGTPYEQQFAAVMLETAGALDTPEDERTFLATRIGSRIGG